MPSAGSIKTYHAPGGLGIRVDSSLYTGYKIPSSYDSLISKLVVHGKDRKEAILKLKSALNEYVIEGVKTTIPLHQKILGESDFIKGKYDIKWLEKLLTK